MNLSNFSRVTAFAVGVTLFACLKPAAAQTPPVENRLPVVRILTPPAGSVFLAPDDLRILATAVDPDGRVVSVEFFANGMSIGTATHPPGVGPVPIDETHSELGPIVPFWLKWENPPVGVHVLTAVATDNLGGKGTSPPVEIKILELPLCPIVSVIASDPEGSEGAVDPGQVNAPDPAVFTIRRTGPTQLPLDVWFKLEGTAVNGKDYDELPLQVTIPAGERKVEVIVKPIDDEEVEGREGVVLALLPPRCVDIYPPPPEWYLLGRHKVARAVILDNDQPANLPPSVEWIHPHDGEVFRAGTTLRLIAAARDPDGTVQSVEFFEGDTSLGMGIPSASEPNRYQLAWPQVPEGEYVLTAVATDDQGATRTTRPVVIKVVEIQLPPVIMIEAVDPEAAEPDSTSAVINTAKFVVRRSVASNTPLRVHYWLGGSASNSVDYLEIPRTVTIPANALSAEILITPIDDNLVEGTESVLIALLPPPCITPIREVRPMDPVTSEDPVWCVPGPIRVARAWIRDNDTQGNLPPKIEIVRPQGGQVFVGPLDLEVVAVARDPDGYIPKFEYYAGDKLIGTQEFNWLVEPTPGETQTSSIVWEDVAPGAYVLRAKATDNLGAEAWSEPVGILVVRPNLPPIVTIFARDPVASEPGVLTVIDTATFVVHRTGSIAHPLRVYYQVGGTAINGTDYTRLSGHVVIPENQPTATIVVNPLFDNLVEGTETVVAELRPPNAISTDPPVGIEYRIGDFARAAAKILDRPGTHNHPPKAEMVRPHNGETFQAPAEIKIVVAAADCDGYVAKVLFFADGTLIGEQLAPVPTSSSAADAEQVFSMVWANPPVGLHVLTAKAIDNQDAWTLTRPVGIIVRGMAEPPLVNITAPDPLAIERPETGTPNTASFRVRRTGNTNEPLTVWYSVAGSAVNGEDYQSIPGTVTIPAGRRSARIVITPIDDELVERVETVLVRLVPSPTMGPIDPYRIGWPARAGAVILDNDAPQPASETLPPGALRFSLGGETGMAYRLEASEDLLDWTPVCDGIADGGQVHYVEPKRDEFRHRFYRMRSIAAEALDLDD